MKQRLKTIFVIGSIAGLAVLAVVFAPAKVRHFRGDGEAGARVWFYDQSAKYLYPAPRDVVPPDGNDDVRVRGDAGRHMSKNWLPPLLYPILTWEMKMC